MLVNDARLWKRLRSLDDPGNLEFPPNYDHHRERGRFEQLVQRLDAEFDCRSEVDRHIEDASFHGRITIPAPATTTGRPLVVVVSNFGGLAVLVVDNPGVWTDAEAAQLLDQDDARRINTALADLGYTPIPEEPLWRRYDGVWALLPSHRAIRPGGFDTSTTCRTATVYGAESRPAARR